MSDPDNNKPDPNLVKVDPITVTVVVIIFLLLPLLLAGFWSQ